MKDILVILLLIIVGVLISFFGCSPLRPYNKVASDQYPRSDKKREILAPVCAVEFPVKPGDRVLVKVETDSTLYNALKSSNTALLEQFIHLRDSIYQLNPTPENKSLKDSATYVLNFLETYAPPALVDVRYYERKVLDSAKQQQLTDARDSEYRGRLKAEAERTAKESQLKETEKKLTKWITYFCILAGVVLIVLVIALVMKFKK